MRAPGMTGLITLKRSGLTNHLRVLPSFGEAKDSKTWRYECMSSNFGKRIARERVGRRTRA
jgi:hypothetical protein